MRLATAALAALLAAGAAQAQQVVDGSDAKLPKDTVAAALEILDAKYKSAGEYQLRALRAGNQPVIVCGELGRKTAAGGFAGFGRFAVNTAKKSAEMFDPLETGENVATAEMRQGGLKALNEIRDMCPDS